MSIARFTTRAKALGVLLGVELLGLLWFNHHPLVQAQKRPQHATFTILNVSNNPTLSNDFLVNVSTNTEYQYGDVTLNVDGTVVAWGGSTLTPVGPSLVQLPFNTYDFANGKHTLTVQDKIGNKDARTVTFSNQFGKISTSPIFDVTPGVKDVPATCTISGTLLSSQAWIVKIQTDDEIPITLHTYTGNSAHIQIIWDGKDAKGNEVANGPYSVVFACRKQTIERTVNKDSLGAGMNPSTVIK